jgi:hypothetical protein
MCMPLLGPPAESEAVRCVVCQEDIAVGHPAVLLAYHPSDALHEMCVRPMVTESVIEYGSDARCPHFRNAIIPPPSSIPPPPPPPSRLPRVPQGSTAVEGASSARLPIILDEADVGRRASPPNRRAQCAFM